MDPGSQPDQGLDVFAADIQEPLDLLPEVTADVPGPDVPLPVLDGIEVTRDPFAVRVKADGRDLVFLESDLGSALYVTDMGTRVIRMVGAPVIRADGDSLVLEYSMEDGRKATATLGKAQEGSLRVTFAVDALEDGERLGMDFRVDQEEAFYGLSERARVLPWQNEMWRPDAMEALDLRGQVVNLLVYPTVSVYSPMFVSSSGYAIYVEEDWPGDYDFGTRDPRRVSIWYETDRNAPSVTFRIISGPTPMEATERYARIVGTTILPPKWTFGPWRWRDDHYNLPAFYDGTPYDGPFNSMVVEDILMMEALDIPCTLYWVDRPWGPGRFGYDDFLWDENRLPQPVQMIRWLKDRDIRFMLWIAPWAVGDMYGEAIDKGYTVDPQLPFADSAGTLIDMTNPEAVSWWQDAMQPRIADGVVGFKCDRGEEKVPDGQLVDGTYFDGTPYRQGRNQFPTWYARAVHGAWQKAGVPEYVTMLRAAWRGTASHAILWGGDTESSEMGLRSAIVALLRSAVMNFPIWGSDTCGYNDMSSSEVCARWLQFSAFCPLMEVGPTGNAAPWSWRAPEETGKVGSGGYGYEPVYDAPMVAVWSLYANLHQDLIDYSYEQAVLSSLQGTPIARPMIYAFPDRPEYRTVWDQYLYGPDILVAPVWKEGTRTRDVLIPDGTWIDAWTGDEMTPNTSVTVDVPYHKIPIYVRKGSGIDMGDLEARWQAAMDRAATPPDLAELARTVSIPDSSR
jgi:alpha-glucosidase (family GH31 glycosyl hydrolase)